ncbi:flavin reductase family protein [Deinococcus multiflagellatus]|uniref:flavin reductase family protein n=1 Tax=Deinococcus multiflagellatus TaxID=1656887 RepID=UPI001CCCED4E|nr:flavin reductase family protein [Deinococcus multiflagellatus]MBZ9714208.1 flavin reductase family protein [Deinococcus multiflagellatus]
MPAAPTPPPQHFDLTALPAAARYKLLTAVVVPRPIAWVCTLGEDGHVNLAPYSFFGLMGSDPPVVAFAPGNRPDGTPKDTARNIGPGGAFTVNLVSFDLAPLMNATATDFPHGHSEPGVLGIALAPGVQVPTPRVVAAPAALECREVQTLTIGRTRIILGEVLGLALQPEAVQDAAQYHVDTAALDLVGRLGGRGTYARTRDTFVLDRLTFEVWQAAQEGES